MDPDAFTQMIQCVHFENTPFSHFVIISKILNNYSTTIVTLNSSVSTSKIDRKITTKRTDFRLTIQRYHLQIKINANYIGLC